MWAHRNKQGFNLRDILTQPLYVPETMNALKISNVSARNATTCRGGRIRLYRGYHHAARPHEYFWRFADLGDTAEPAIVTREDGSLLVDGMIPIDELRETIALKEFDLEDADYSTLAGFYLITN